MFSYYERTLAVVPRWSIAPRLNPQSVAEHSYYVALYSDKLGELLNWAAEKKVILLAYALRHDMVEAQTGDTPGPVKRQITDPVKLQKFEQNFYSTLGPDYQMVGVTDEIKRVVKAADLIDELFWVSMEVLMGNRLMEHQKTKVQQRLNVALNNIGLNTLFMDLMSECSAMGRGIDLPENNEDLRR